MITFLKRDLDGSAWILMSIAHYIISFIVWFTTEGESECSVTPAAVAIIAGDRVSLTCTSDVLITGWKRGSDVNSRYVFDSASRVLVNGYSVDDSVKHKLILTISKASTVQADRYFCTCRTLESNAATVIVLVAQPMFSETTELTDGELVSFICSISFNGTASISVIIEYPYETTSCKRNYDGISMDLHNTSVDYHARADSRIYQIFYCSLKLTDRSSKAILYYRKLTASMLWVSVRNVKINPVNGTQCYNGSQCAINQTVHCTSEGNPKPITFRWLTSLNGSRFIMTEKRDDQLTFTTTGGYEIRCITFNEFYGKRYNSSSSIFKTQVVDELELEGSRSNVPNLHDNKIALIVGVVIGVGGALLTA